MKIHFVMHLSKQGVPQNCGPLPKTWEMIQSNNNLRVSIVYNFVKTKIFFLISGSGCLQFHSNSSHFTVQLHPKITPPGKPPKKNVPPKRVSRLVVSASTQLGSKGLTTEARDSKRLQWEPKFPSCLGCITHNFQGLKPSCFMVSFLYKTTDQSTLWLLT